MTKRSDPAQAIALPPEVVQYIDEIPTEHRTLFDELHRLALETIPEVSVTYSYKMPAYLGAGGRVSLSNGGKGVSLATRVPAPITRFHEQHPEFTVGKVTVLFRPGDTIPTDDVRELIRSATQ